MKHLRTLAFALLIGSAFNAQTSQAQENHSIFHLSTQVHRTVEKDVMHAEISARQNGKDLATLKKSLSAQLNPVLDHAKSIKEIELNAEGIQQYADYNDKGKIIGWVAEGRIQLQSKNFEAIAHILDNLKGDVAISHIHFSVSKEKIASLEDEMTQEIIRQFQHKAELIRQSLNAKTYRLSEVRLDTPNGETPLYETRMYSAKAENLNTGLPLEAGKQTLSASASGKVVLYQ